MNFDACTHFLATARKLLEPINNVAAMLAGLIDGAFARAVMVSDEAEITLRQAAELLGIARSTVIGLIGNGILRSSLVGNDRLPIGDVLA